MESASQQICYAAVKYVGDHYRDKTENVHISKVFVETKDYRGKSVKTPFQPKHVSDFDPQKLYIVYSSQDVPHGKEISNYALIGKLADSLENLTKTYPRSRLRFSVVHGHVSDPPDTETDQTSDGEENHIALEQRAQKAKRLANVRSVKETDLHDYLNRNKVMAPKTNASTNMMNEETGTNASLINLHSAAAGSSTAFGELSHRLSVVEQRLSETNSTDLESLKTFFADQFRQLTEVVSTQMQSFQTATKAEIQSFQNYTKEEMQSFKTSTKETMSGLQKEMEETKGLIRKSPSEMQGSVQDWVNNIPEDMVCQIIPEDVVCQL